MSLVDSVYYPTMRLCLENTPLIRIWVKCVSPAQNQGTEGATPLQPTQMVPQLCRGLLKGGGWYQHRKVFTRLCMSWKFYSVKSSRSEVFVTHASRCSMEDCYWRQIFCFKAFICFRGAACFPLERQLAFSFFVLPSILVLPNQLSSSELLKHQLSNSES